jgi:hypothetical protein
VIEKAAIERNEGMFFRLYSTQGPNDWLFNGQLFGEIYAEQKGVFIICECVEIVESKRWSFGTVFIDLLEKSWFVLDSQPIRGMKMSINGQCIWRREICSHYVRGNDLLPQPKTESVEFIYDTFSRGRELAPKHISRDQIGAYPALKRHAEWIVPMLDLESEDLAEASILLQAEGFPLSMIRNGAYLEIWSRETEELFLI